MQHRSLPHLATRMFNEPLLIHPGKAQVIMQAVGHRFGVGQVLAPGSEPQAISFFDDDEADDDRYTRTPYDTLQGIAVIPIDGTLVHKNGTIRPYSGMTGYDGIRNAFLAAQADADIRAVALHIDSPGGEVSGCFDLVDTIASYAGGKPCWAILDEVAYSAAYAIACAADRIVMPRTGGAGSIGVIAMLADLSQALSKDGITVNIIQFGDRKAWGNAYEPLPSEARARFQAKIDMLGEMFVSMVAKNRRITSATVRSTQADCFMADEAVRLGLADAVMAPDEALSALLASL